MNGSAARSIGARVNALASGRWINGLETMMDHRK
jgi:hypothetical protein